MRVRNRKFALLAMGVWLSLSAACGRHDASSSSSSSSPYNDREIAAITKAIHEGEIEVGALATTRALNVDVQKYNKDVVEAHHGMFDREKEILIQLGIEPLDSATSLELRKDAEQVNDHLQSLTGAVFDHAYVEDQVVVHAKVLSLLDVQLLPRVQSEELRTELTHTRADLAKHLMHAEALQGRIP